jgi:hypothetical protein
MRHRRAAGRTDVSHGEVRQYVTTQVCSTGSSGRRPAEYVVASPNDRSSGGCQLRTSCPSVSRSYHSPSCALTDSEVGQVSIGKWSASPSGGRSPGPEHVTAEKPLVLTATIAGRDSGVTQPVEQVRLCGHPSVQRLSGHLAAEALAISFGLRPLKTARSVWWLSMRARRPTGPSPILAAGRSDGRPNSMQLVRLSLRAHAVRLATRMRRLGRARSPARCFCGLRHDAGGDTTVVHPACC